MVFGYERRRTYFGHDSGKQKHMAGYLMGNGVRKEYHGMGPPDSHLINLNYQILSESLCLLRRTVHNLIS